MTDNASNAPVSLEQVLTSKEQRARRQQAWLFQSDHTVVSVTLVWPGAVKDTGLARRVMAVANEALGELFRTHQWTVCRQQTLAAGHRAGSALVGGGPGLDDQARHRASRR